MTSIFDIDNLFAWCIVPFDRAARDAEQRADMLKRLGLASYVYDWRRQHVDHFEDEIVTMQRHGIRIRGWWMPVRFDDTSQRIVDLLARHRLDCDLWITGGGEPTRDAAEQQARIEQELERLEPTLQAAAALGVRVGLYNHGGWFGEPANQLQLIDGLLRRGHPHVGIVFNLHHGRPQLDDLPHQLALMQPHLLALNLNGTMSQVSPDTPQPHIIPLGQGDRDVEILHAVAQCGWHGPVGVLCHSAEVDAEHRLLDNLEGLRWLRAQLQEGAPGPRPVPRTWPEHQSQTATSTRRP